LIGLALDFPVRKLIVIHMSDCWTQGVNIWLGRQGMFTALPAPPR